MATPEAFERNPELVHRFYNLRRQQLLSEAQPNRRILRWQTGTGACDNLLIVTQNVDNLHEKAEMSHLSHAW